MKRLFSLFLLLVISLNTFGQESENITWTDTTYPDYISKITDFGERVDFSHDGTKILFLNRNFGDAYELELNTGIITPLTHHFYHAGFTRAIYLANGDILLSGPKQFNPEEAFEWRRFRSE